jgi:uncharacterized protein YbbK (DUF523 family)
VSLPGEDVVLVSACLLGEACRHDGKDQRRDRVLAALAGKSVVPVCPEAAAGLGIPRPPVELTGSGEQVLQGQARAVLCGSGEDRTAAFLRGAQIAADAATRFGATSAILKERSPSCGTHAVWVAGTLVAGQGVTAAALRGLGLKVQSDEEL